MRFGIHHRSRPKKKKKAAISNMRFALLVTGEGVWEGASTLHVEVEARRCGGAFLDFAKFAMHCLCPISVERSYFNQSSGNKSWEWVVMVVQLVASDWSRTGLVPIPLQHAASTRLFLRRVQTGTLAVAAGVLGDRWGCSGSRQSVKS